MKNFERTFDMHDRIRALVEKALRHDSLKTMEIEELLKAAGNDAAFIIDSATSLGR